MDLTNEHDKYNEEINKETSSLQIAGQIWKTEKHKRKYEHYVDIITKQKKIKTIKYKNIPSRKNNSKIPGLAAFRNHQPKRP